MAGLAIFALATPAMAQSDPASDALGQCLVSSSTGRDRLTLVEWIFSAIASHPDVKQFTNVTDDQRAQLSQQAADTFVRLLTVDCHPQSLAVLRGQDAMGMRAAFEQLGRIAMADLMSDPSVQQQLAELGKKVNTPAMQALAKEAKQQP
jgi:hypothetical protein